MRKLSRLLMILCLVLITSSCQSIPNLEPEIIIPEFGIKQPERPMLLEIPRESVEAIRTLTTNLSIMDGYTRLLELYINSIQKYYDGILTIVNQA